MPITASASAPARARVLLESLVDARVDLRRIDTHRAELCPHLIARESGVYGSEIRGAVLRLDRLQRPDYASLGDQR